MAVQLKAFKFLIKPTKIQESILNKTFGCARFVWNQLVENFNEWSPNVTSLGGVHRVQTWRGCKSPAIGANLNEVSRKIMEFFIGFYGFS